MAGPSDAEIAKALSRLGNYRVKRAQVVAHEGDDDGISGALLLALGLRETWGLNVEGGARYDETAGRWVALRAAVPDEAARMDVGWLQISRRWHREALLEMPAVKAGTWGPPQSGVTPMNAGFVPRFEESLRHVIPELREAVAYGLDNGVPDHDAVRFAVAAHNAGIGGAMSGWRAGDVDKYTAGGDYSAWVLQARTAVNRWVAAHPNWKAA